jgi:hypothetical protein
MRRQFFVADCPPERCVADWLDDQTGFRAIGDRMTPSRSYPPMFRVTGLPIDVPGLEAAIRAVFARHGWHGWRHATGASEAYGGFSLVHNPNHPADRDPHAAVLGTDALDLGGFYGSSLPLGKDSYQDTYGFCVRTPGSREGALGRLMDGFVRTQVRSSVRELHARFFEPALLGIGPAHPYASAAGWHCDERVFENLRINIPVTGAPIFTLELASPDDPPVPVYDAPLEVGTAYAWNTYWPHRPMAKERADLSRINIVLGFSPWFDYRPEDACWEANEFFGEAHPFDLLADGHIHPDATIEEIPGAVFAARAPREVSASP